jgi:hypothetical protein
MSNTYRPQRILENIRDGMHKNDVVLITDGVCTKDTKITFDYFNSKSNRKSLLRIPDFLGLIEGIHYTIKNSYNPVKKRKYVDLILSHNIDIYIDKLRYTLKLYKGDRINVFTHLSGITYTELNDLITKAGFDYRLQQKENTGTVIYILKAEFSDERIFNQN